MLKKVFKFLMISAIIFLIFLTAVIVREQPVVRQLPGLVESRVYDNGGSYVPLSEIPPTLRKAVIDTEDRSFYVNPGVSVTGTIRSLAVDLVKGQYSEGGSTITQQLAKNLFLTEQKTISRKIKEMILAVMITHNFSKDDILAMYLNSVYFGHHSYGANSAAKIYFNKKPQDLNDVQCTLLAGLPQAPGYLDPFVNYQASRTRQWEVLQAMVKAGDLDQTQANQIRNMPLNLR